MRATRFAFAMETAGLALPELGDIAVFAPTMGDDLSAMPAARLLVITGFKPDYDAFAVQGLRVAITAPEPAATQAAPSTALVCLPRARDRARLMIAQANATVAPGGMVLVDGQKTDGVDGMLRDLRGRVTLDGPVSKAHGKLAWFMAQPGLFQDWAALATPRVLADGFRTAPGVFSADGPDPGSVALAAALPAKLGGRVADLGAGWGFLSAAILAREGVRSLHVVEADHAALTAAQENITDPRAVFHWADATRFVPPQKLDTIVMNPPFHTGRGADPELGVAFIRAAAGMLTPGGVLWMVANRHLPYERALVGLFQEVSDQAMGGAYKITRAARPIVAAKTTAAKTRARR